MMHSEAEGREGLGWEGLNSRLRSLGFCLGVPGSC